MGGRPAGRRDRRDGSRLRPGLQPDPGPARQPSAQPRARARDRQAGDPPLPLGRRPARRAGRPGRRAPARPGSADRAVGARPSATGRRPSSTRSRGRSTTRGPSLDLGLAISFSGLVFRRGEEASAEVAAARARRPAARRDRLAVPGTAGRAAVAQRARVGAGHRALGSPNAAARRSRRLGLALVEATTDFRPIGEPHDAPLDPFVTPAVRPSLMAVAAVVAVVGLVVAACGSATASPSSSTPLGHPSRRPHPAAAPPPRPAPARPESPSGEPRPSPAELRVRFRCGVRRRTAEGRAAVRPVHLGRSSHPATDADLVTFAFGAPSLPGPPARRRVRSRPRFRPSRRPAAGCPSTSPASTLSRSASPACRS